MTGDRARGAVLYTSAAVLLVAGGTWWVLAAPRGTTNPEVEAWRAAATQLLPEDQNNTASDMLELTAGADHDVVADVGVGTFRVTLVCAGGTESRVRVSVGNANDSGLGMPCTGQRTPTSFELSVVSELHMNVTVSDAAPVVFRYAVSRATN